tara:strand:- start:1309 stop:1410 length:102 start_codon:yes stop_codon:yes gene_type:complete
MFINVVVDRAEIHKKKPSPGSEGFFQILRTNQA